MGCVPVATAAEVCANCGKEGSTAVNLKNCNACYLVKYCSVDCQKIHRKQHKNACKERAAELKDEKLYGQGHERAEGDFCPLCLLAIPLPMDNRSTIRVCCMKLVCDGCCLAASKGGLGNNCPFCHTPSEESDRKSLQMIRKRVAAKDPEGIAYLGDLYYHGVGGLDRDMPRGIELWSEAAELGSDNALFNLGVAYYHGLGAVQDRAKGIRSWEKAAMKGDARSRHNLGKVELTMANSTVQCGTT